MAKRKAAAERKPKGKTVLSAGLPPGRKVRAEEFRLANIVFVVLGWVGKERRPIWISEPIPRGSRDAYEVDLGDVQGDLEYRDADGFAAEFMRLYPRHYEAGS